MNDTTHVVCPDCAGVNRIASARVHDRPICGKCKQPLFNGMPVDLNSASFDRHISRNDIPLVVDFWAPWCGPCRAMAPAFSQAANQLEPAFRLAKLNTEAEPNIAMRMKISSIPTIILFVKGREIARHSGAMTAAGIDNWVQSAMRSRGPDQA